MRVADVDDEIRAAVFVWLDSQKRQHGDRIPWKVLQSFEYGGQRVSLITQRGIRWLSGMPALTFTTTYSADPRQAPYADHVGHDGLPRYKYQGDDPDKYDNRSMKQAERLGKPLVWLVGTGDGVYSAVYPVYIEAHDDAALEFTVAVDAEQRALVSDPRVDPDVKRRYVERLTRQRLHQPIFRGQVLRAYDTRCAVCRLRHASLLDAAHIRPDSLGGAPVVTNGMAMCKIHHAAYDEEFLSVDPDYTIHIKPSILEEQDGPMLLHGLQEVHGRAIELPRRKVERPDRDLLDERHQAFLSSA